jgi:two-component system, LytTR family, sensor kinase
MNNSFELKRIRLYLWMGLAYLLLCFFSYIGKYPGQSLELLLNNVWRFPYTLVVNFIFFEYVVSFVLRKRRYIVYNILLGIVLLWLFLVIWSYGFYNWRSLGIHIGFYTELATFTSYDHALEAQMAYSAGSIFVFGVVRHLYDYIKLRQATQQLRIEKQAAELNYLRSQTNPHFLFNTLNNIYSLSRDKSDLAPESILRLSKILRFMLYETSGNYIPIEQEIKIINDYIELERLRYDESLRVIIIHDIEDMKQALPPLLLIPLVENAFKHGVSETRDQPFVDIHLSVSKRRLLFTVRNSVGTAPSAEGVKENIGLSNLRRQLELLYHEYDLSARQEGFVFVATLKINLGSHV